MKMIVSGISSGEFSSIINDLVAGILVPLIDCVKSKLILNVEDEPIRRSLLCIKVFASSDVLVVTQRQLTSVSL